MSKWGDRKINGAEQIIEPKIYPVGLFWDGNKLAKPFKKIFNWWVSLMKEKKLNVRDYHDFMDYAVAKVKRDIIESFQIMLGLAIFLFLLFIFIKGVFSVFNDVILFLSR